jgi:hypothetical protein
MPLGRMDAVLYLRQAARFKSMELERVEVIFRLEASSRSRLRFARGNRSVARKRSPFELAPTDFWPGTISGLLGIQFSMRVIAWFRKLSLTAREEAGLLPSYCSFANSAWASFRMGMSGSASFQRVSDSKNSWLLPGEKGSRHLPVKAPACRILPACEEVCAR